MHRLILALISYFFLTTSAFAGWTVWAPLGGQIQGDPAACTYGNHTVVVVRGTDNNFWARSRYLPTGVWKPWKRLATVLYPNTPLTFRGSPSVICYFQSNTVQFKVAAISTNRALYFLNGWIQNNEVQSQWWHTTNEAIAAPIYSGIAMTASTYQRNYFVVNASDRRLFYKNYDSNTSTLWRPITLLATSMDPAAVELSPSRLDVFYRDTNGRLFTHQRLGTQWTARQEIAGATYSSPEAISRNQTEMDLFARGPNNILMQKRWINGIWGPWENLGGNVTSGPGATTYASNQRKFVFVRWGDGSLYYRAWAP